MFWLFKINESRYIALFVVIWSINELSSIDYVDIYLFLKVYSIDFFWLKSMGLPHITYIMMH